MRDRGGANSPTTRVDGDHAESHGVANSGSFGHRQQRWPTSSFHALVRRKYAESTPKNAPSCVIEAERTLCARGLTARYESLCMAGCGSFGHRQPSSWRLSTSCSSIRRPIRPTQATPKAEVPSACRTDAPITTARRLDGRGNCSGKVRGQFK